MTEIMRNEQLKLDDITIDPELRDVLPALNMWEMKKLTNSIKREGMHHPLIIWKRDGTHYLVDGHQRLKALKNIEMTDFDYELMEFSDKASAKEWIVENQITQRRVRPFVEFLAIQGFMQEIQKEPKDRKRKVYLDITGMPLEPIMIASLMGVSEKTVSKMQYVYATGCFGILEMVKDGIITVDAAYSCLKKEEKEHS